jgi:hypothetical protein
MQPKNPVRRERVPTVGDSSLPALVDRFSPAPLSPMAVAFLKQSLAQYQRRRRVYRGRHLRVCIDGEECWQCELGVGVCGPFSLPLSASHVEVFGDDNQGALLLAVFPLSEPVGVEDGRAQHLWVTLEGGQTIEIEISSNDAECGKLSAYVIQIAYSEAAQMDARGAITPAIGAPLAVSRSEASTPGYALMSDHAPGSF